MRLGTAAVKAGSLRIEPQRLFMQPHPRHGACQADVRRRAAEPVFDADRRIDSTAGLDAPVSNPFAHVDRRPVRTRRLCIAAERRHRVAERHVRRRIVRIDPHGPPKVPRRLGMPPPPGLGQALPHMRRYVVWIQREAAPVLYDSKLSPRRLPHEQRMPAEHTRRRVRRIDLDGP